MRRHTTILALFVPTLLLFSGSVLPAQRHGGRSAPPTPQFIPPPPPLVAASSGLGVIQFAAVNYGVPAPQSLTRQLRFDDDRTRAAALSAVGAPSQYLQHGHIPFPRSLDLVLAPLGNTDDMDALLTVELDQHIITAVLIPVDGNWRRIATLTFSTPFDNSNTTPTTWLRTARSLVQTERYRAIFHASSGSLATISSNFTENEAQLRVINGKAVVTLSFESTVRDCTALPPVGQPVPRGAPKPSCDLTQRWFQSDPTDPTHRFELITGSGRLMAKELQDPLISSRTVLLSHLRNFACQPFVFSEATQHYEPSAPNAPCRSR